MSSLVRGGSRSPWRSFPAPGVKPEILWVVPAAGLSLATAYAVVSGIWPAWVLVLVLPPAFVLIQRYPLLGLLAWLFFEPFLITTQTNMERRLYWVVHRALPPATLVLVLLSHALKVKPRQFPRWGVPEFAAGLYLLSGLFSIWLQNPSPQATSYLFYDRVFIPFCLYCLVRILVPGEKALRLLVPAAIWVGATQGIIGVLSWTVPGLLPKDWLDLAGARATGSLDSPSVYSSTLMFCGLLLLHVGQTWRSRGSQVLGVGLFLFTLLGVFLSYSRGSWLAAVLVLLGVFVVYPRFTLRLALVLGPVVALIGGWLLADQLSFAQQRLNNQDTALSRLPVFYAGYRMFVSKPVFGWGYGNFDLYDRQFQGRVGDLVNPEKDHASHNVYLTLLSEQGLVGFALFMAPVVWWLLGSWKAYPRLPKHGFWNRDLLVLLWLAILHHIVVNNFSNMREVYGLGLWWITLGLIANLVASGRRPPRFDPSWSLPRIGDRVRSDPS